MILFIFSLIISLYTGQQPKYKAIVYESDMNQTLIYDPATYEILKKKSINRETVKFSIFQGDGQMRMWWIDKKSKKKILISTFKINGIDKSGTMIAKHTSMGGVESTVLIKITGSEAAQRILIDFLGSHQYEIYEVPITYHYPTIPEDF